MSEIEELKALIEAGSVKNITAFGKAKLGLPVPYVVIVPGPAFPDRRAYQVWAHFAVGQNEALENYVLYELPRLVGEAKNCCMQDKYKTNGSYDGVGVDQGDNTLRAGMTFYLPLILRGNGGNL